MKPNVRKLVVLARVLAKGEDEALHARRAFDLAHRSRRLLELAAETASRDRWDVLEYCGGAEPYEPTARLAAACANESIKYPVKGEAAVYAALLNAVDTAHMVADKLYDAWLETQPREAARPVLEGVNRLGAPLAPGCTRFSCGSGDDEASSGC